jgi:hypothetical protein
MMPAYQIICAQRLDTRNSDMKLLWEYYRIDKRNATDPGTDVVTVIFFER